jgi:hypothetical protein
MFSRAIKESPDDEFFTAFVANDEVSRRGKSMGRKGLYRAKLTQQLLAAK